MRGSNIFDKTLASQLPTGQIAVVVVVVIVAFEDSKRTMIFRLNLHGKCVQNLM